MNYDFHSKGIIPVYLTEPPAGNKRKYFRIFLAMKLTVLFIAIFTLKVSAVAYSQGITLSLKNADLKTAIKALSRQSDYDFVYDERYLRHAKPISINLTNIEMERALKSIMSGQPFTYEIFEKSIIIKPDKSLVEAIGNQLSQPATIRGHVTDSLGTPLAGASVKVKGTSINTLTDREGNFTLRDLKVDAILQISFIGYVTQELPAHDAITVILEHSQSKLDEAVVIAYGTTTQRLNTGSVSRITAKQIENQPVGNPLAALSGHIPGLVVSQSNGVPGSSFTVQIRGRNSFAQGSEPLFIIDGIPFASGNDNINILSSSIGNQLDGGGLSPFSTINPQDIESIEVLKDADATAIYGSRGANGVVLITTKRGRSGHTAVNANVYHGFSQIGNTMELLNTQQYLQMRREAFANDGISPNRNNAQDLFAWDTTRYTNFKDLYIGNTAKNTNAQLSFSGGNDNTQFLISGAYNSETTVFPGDAGNKRGSTNLNVSHSSQDRRFKANLSASYSSSNNNSLSADLTSHIFEAPNAPYPVDADGNLVWEEGGVEYFNPLSYLKEHYEAKTNNLIANLQLEYQVIDRLTAKILMGYNSIDVNENHQRPLSAISPFLAPQRTSQFGTNNFNGWNIEPQIEYNSSLWKGKLIALIGTTFQQNERNSTYLSLSGYSSDALLGSITAGSNVAGKSSSHNLYRYHAFFGRVNYNLADKYLINITGRRDGSSRFGPSQRFSNFGALGAAWIFTEENWFKQSLSVLSYGKIRGSYGITGNDQIGDYQYLDSWSSGSRTYNNSAVLTPDWLSNESYSWEENKKFELAMELGMVKDRILFSVAYFRNRSSNQLVQYTLPYITGFGGITRNFPATIQNTGWELQLTADVLSQRHFSWKSSLNITLPKNVLVDFPAIESSSYAASYVVGEPLNLINNYRYLGVDPQTGQYQLLDVDGNGIYNVNDYVVNGHMVPRHYGGISNTFTYKNLQLDFLFDFRKQTGRNYLHSLSSSMYSIGGMQNVPQEVLNRWQHSGDITDIPKLTTTRLPPFLYQSDRAYGDADFLRLRNVALSYTLPSQISKYMYSRLVRLYFQGQNLFTVTNYEGNDPETQQLFRLPPLKTYTFGLSFSL